MIPFNIYILCGGESSRMGTEKGLLMWQGKTFVDHLISACSPFDQEIKLVTSSPLYTNFSLSTLPDIVPKKGPLGGIYTALLDSKTTWSLILSCDTPFISTLLLTQLLEAITSTDKLICAQTEGKTHPLIGFYHQSLVPKIEENINQNNLKMMNFVEKSSKQVVFKNKLAKQCMNINTKEEYLTLLSNA
jgi:molybdenum cofactor guanylyltransferase